MNTKKVAIIMGTGTPIDIALEKALAAENISVEIIEHRLASPAADSDRAGKTFLDCTNEEEIQSAIKVIVNKWQRIDYLINCPDQRLNIKLTDMEDENWENSIRFNLSIVFLMCKHVLPTMIKQKQGKIINITSDAARLGAIKGVAYAAAKAGVIGFSKSLSREVGGQGISVNLVSLGLIGEDAIPFAEDLERNSIPLGRLGKWEEAADVIACLLSDKTSYMTGQTVHVDGGLYMP